MKRLAKREQAKWGHRCGGCWRDLWKGQCHNVSCPRYLIGNRLRFKAGCAVVVRAHQAEGVRWVVSVYSDIDGGRRLDRPVDGFVSWNVDALRCATRRDKETI